MKRGQGVYVILCCPYVQIMRELIIHQEFPDTPVDKFIDKRVSEIMEELLLSGIEQPNMQVDCMYQILIDDILDYLSHFVWVVGIKSISCWYDDTILIDCSPIGVKDVNCG